MTDCLITGATGFLGREVFARFKRDYDVTGIARHAQGEGLASVDLRDGNQFRHFLRQHRPDVVLHLAAYRDPDVCEDQLEEARRLNVEPVRILRDELPASSRLVLISTDYVFDGEQPPYHEDDPRRPVNAYGSTKCEAEDLIMDRPGTIILRVPLLVGAGPTIGQSGFISQIIDGLQAKREVILDDVLLRFPIWTRDVAEILAFLLAGNHQGVFHGSGPRGATRYAWTVEVAKRLGWPSAHLKPSDAVVPRKARRPLNSQLSTDKIRAAGYTRFTEFPDVVEDVMRSFAETL